MQLKKLGQAITLTLLPILLVTEVSAQTMEELSARLDALANENASLRERVTQLEEQKHTLISTEAEQATTTNSSDSFSVQVNHQFAYDILDPTTNINRKQSLLLEGKRSGELGSNSVYLSGAITPIANYQKSNTESKFGYLMRHPTASNQRTETVSEAVLHSAQIGLTATLGDWTTAYMEVLYDPQQSFGAGTTTALSRNQLQVRRGYVMLGNLDESPFYVSLGKMATPFGLTDTVNPFTASTVWHAFGGLAYGANAGYSKNGLNFNVMAVQGGAQFRSANMPVDNSNVPSKLNNLTADLNYTFNLGNSNSLMFGGSYIKGSAYCQDFPVTHFNSCADSNAAYDIYTQLKGENWLLQAEYAETEDLWAGTFNPSIPEFEASKVSSWDVGAKINSHIKSLDVDYSVEFSRFVAGPSGSPWENQDQIVVGMAAFLNPSTKLFAEFIHTSGYAPLNFISGGNLDPGVTHSDRNASSDILMIGVNAAF